jgi:hypothetical protein
MKSHKIALICIILFVLVSISANADQKATVAAIKNAVDASANLDAAAKTIVLEKLLPVMTNKTLVAEAKAQNAKGVSLEEIKRIDSEWQKAETPLPIMKEKLGSACAVELKKLQSQIT